MLKDEKTINVSFSNRTVIRVVFFVILALLVIGFFSRISSAIRLIIASGFLAIALNPAVSWITRHLPSKSRVRATAVAYLFVVGVLIGFFVLVVPPFVTQVVDLFRDIPTSVQDIENQDTPIVRFLENNNLTDEYTQVISDVKDNFENIAGRAVTTATVVGSGIASFIAVLIMTFMMLIEGPAWLQKFVAMQPRSKVDKRLKVLKDMYRLVTGYVNGQLVIGFIAAVFAFFALAISSTILSVSINPIALACIVGLIGLIPMFGNILAACIVVLFCLFVSLPLAVIMAVYFLIYQQVENATFQPYIQSKYNELTPLTVFIAAIIGVSVAGFLGALIAIPVVGCIRIYLKAYYGDKLAPKNTKTIAV
jgi:predicted PurR-regulated permease PerM